MFSAGKLGDKKHKQQLKGQQVSKDAIKNIWISIRPFSKCLVCKILMRKMSEVHS